MMKHITKRDGVTRVVFDWQTMAVITNVIDRRFGFVADINAQYVSAQQSAQVMRDEAVAATDIQDVCAD
jgi:hypothetical protein